MLFVKRKQTLECLAINIADNINDNTYFILGIILCILYHSSYTALFDYLLGKEYYVLHKSSYICFFSIFNEIEISPPFYL